MKTTRAPMFNWDLPKVEMPEDDDGTFPALTAEQWVYWFRTQPTATQIAAAATILDLQRDGTFAPTPARPAGSVNLTVEELRARIVDIQSALRSILSEAKDLKPQKKRSAMLVERITAIGIAIKGMGL